jgi:hypothetical protein
VLTRAAAEHPRAREIYKHGVAAGESFDRIERALVEALPELRHPLVPRNVPWFTVRPQTSATRRWPGSWSMRTARTAARAGTCTASRCCFPPTIGRP